MKLLVCDYSGHPFQIELSKNLAKRGYNVTHIYCSSFSTPRGDVRNGEIGGYEIRPIKLKKNVDKNNFINRRKSDIEFGNRLLQEIKSLNPQYIFLSNVPLDSLRLISKYCIHNNIPYIFWLQDIYSLAMKNILRKRIGLLGNLITYYYSIVEKIALLNAKKVIAITEDFVPLLHKMGINEKNIKVIPNWAPLNELPLLNEDNDWSSKNNLLDRKVILYSGTLGFKHNPELFIRLSKKIKDEDAIILIISQGPGVEFIKNEKSKLDLDNIRFMPFQDFSDMPKILASACILVGVLEKEAGKYSVPSKVLTYLTAGKPIALSVPKDNLASKIIKYYDAGICFEPEQDEEFLESVKELLNDNEKRKTMGKNARRYAENNFDINKITNNFISLIHNN